MDVAKIRELVELVAESGIAELEIEEEGLSLRIAGAITAPVMAVAPHPAAAPAPPVNPAPATAPIPETATASSGEPSWREVTSPIVADRIRTTIEELDETIRELRFRGAEVVSPVEGAADASNFTAQWRQVDARFGVGLPRPV